MSLSHKHVGSKISAKIEIYILTRAELLCPLCYEMPCTTTARLYSNYLHCKIERHLWMFPQICSFRAKRWKASDKFQVFRQQVCVASRDEKILLKLQKENHDLSFLSTEKKLCQKKKIFKYRKKFSTTLQFVFSILIPR